MKKLAALLLAVLMLLGAACTAGTTVTAPAAEMTEAPADETAAPEATEEPAAEETAAKPEGEVVILYTNDIHSYINNTKKDADGNTVSALTYASVAALKNELLAEGKNVLLVDCGDEVQGTAYGSFDEGKSVIELMNATGYQLATIGNHEFDYGQYTFFQNIERADFPYVSCNFFSTETGELVLEPYKILETGGIKIAFIGITTPETITKSTPVYFMDENRDHYIYNFYGAESERDLYDVVQNAIDAARKDGADYVIGLGHLGVDPSSAPCRSVDVINNTHGLDAFIDGHSHTTMPCEVYQDTEGNDVVLTQTGCYLAAIGKMTIKDGEITSELITEYDAKDETIDALTQQAVGAVDTALGEKIGVLDSAMCINDPATGNRMVRNRETNLGDLCADSFYYYFNEVMGLDCDVAIQNGGGVRTQLEAGDVTYLDVKNVAPFGNQVCLKEATGQEILDALECCARTFGIIDEQTGRLAEGKFLHVAGMRFSVDTSIESTVTVDNNGTWISGPSGGQYRVHDVEVYNRTTGEYEPLDLDRTYRIAGINYLLGNSGDGLAMFNDINTVQDYVGEDYLITAAYIKAFKVGEDGYPHVNTASSPLAAYSGYLLDYENPYGSGRIVID